MAVQEFSFTDGSESPSVATHYFTIAELRAQQTTLANATNYPDAKLEEARAWAEETIEHEEAAGVAFVPRTETETIRVAGLSKVWLKWPKLRSITSVTVAGVALTADELAALVLHNMAFSRTDAFGTTTEPVTVVVTYTHGYDTPSARVKSAALMLAAEYAIGDNLGSRATSESTDVGFIRLSIAAPGGKTGIPYVDSVIVDERRRARGGTTFVG